jgi:hypothetical protein
MRRMTKKQDIKIKHANFHITQLLYIHENTENIEATTVQPRNRTNADEIKTGLKKISLE